ncbi:serine/threonine protein kinase [Pelomyxa schiedti]|nr:serine/threonine protein kinase [Pelomyxa schiedti]
MTLFIGTNHQITCRQSEYVVASTLEPHPNINRYFCHFVDRIPVEYYNHLPPVVQELAFDQVQDMMGLCVWVVLEHHSETLGHFLTHITNNCGASNLGPCTTTPWPIVHKYSRDICAALVHLFVNETVHFDIKLDNILVSSNKEQVILIDFGCATTSKKFEAKTESVISATGNQSHRAPEIINGMAKYSQNPDQSSTLYCDKQPSFELGCILFELAMCGKHPLPGYPCGYGPCGEVTFSFESEELFPMKPPQFPKQFCDLVRSLLQCDPDKRMPLLDAFELLLNIEPPSPSELLSFYSCVVPLTNDAGTLTSKATCQILCGASTEDCVDTLQKALNQMTHRFNSYAVQASLRGKTASFTPTDVEFTRAIINKKHRNTLPELVLTALWTGHISCDAESFNKTLLLLKKSSTAVRIHQSGSCAQVTTPVSIFMSVIYTRNEMMMEALVQLQVGDIDSALALVANAFSLFQSEMVSIGEAHQDCEYLPGLLFLVCLCLVINDHKSLHQHIPTCLSLAFSRALSARPGELMRAHCTRVLTETNVTSEKQTLHNKIEVIAEWNDLVSVATSHRGNIDPRISTSPTISSELLSCMFFVALWRLYCSENQQNGQSSSESVHIFVDLSERNNMITHSPVGKIHWCASSVTSLGLCYLCGVGGVDKDIHRAAMLYQMAADAGDARATYYLGVCYYNGDGVEKDLHKAVTLLQRAADAGHTPAMFNLGVCYYNGEGVDKDIHKAVTLYQRAADTGDATATCNLGVCYQNGDGVDRDFHKAVTLFQRAADARDAHAINNLGVCYENGYGVEKDIHKAMSLYQRAADACDTNAMCNLGLCYEYGTGVEKDSHKSVTLFQRAADAGDAEAMCNLGVCYENGEGVEKDIHKAVSLYQRAADAGDAMAMTSTRQCHCGRGLLMLVTPTQCATLVCVENENGSGADKDIHKAVTLYQRAADAGDATAMWLLGLCYENGDGVDKDTHKAVALFQRAAELGDVDANTRLSIPEGNCESDDFPKKRITESDNFCMHSLLEARFLQLSLPVALWTALIDCTSHWVSLRYQHCKPPPIFGGGPGD